MKLNTVATNGGNVIYSLEKQKGEKLVIPDRGHVEEIWGDLRTGAQISDISCDENRITFSVPKTVLEERLWAFRKAVTELGRKMAAR